MDLILTSWTLEYAVAAAIALTELNNSDVIGVSKRRFPELLQDIYEKRVDDLETIYIIGVGIDQSPQKVKRLLTKFNRRGCRVVWLSTHIPNSPQTFDDELIVPGEKIYNVVSKYFAVRKNSADVTRLLKIMSVANSSQDLVNAASYFYRTYQDLKPYTDAVRTLANEQSFSPQQKSMISEFQRFKARELQGNSLWIKNTRKMVRKIGAEGNCRVLVTGATGTGKETIATLVHRYSPRQQHPFVAFNCADLSPQLLESRLFGHEKGAFTGAENQRLGAFEMADGGTLFLDEVGELSANAQAGLLRVLQEGRFFRVGGEQEIVVDVRIVAATHRNLPEMIVEGTFREDLFYRLSTVIVNVPPIHERPEDLLVIAENYQLNRKYGRLTEAQKAALLSYDWPGNVRELQNILDRTNILGVDDYAEVLRQHQVLMNGKCRQTDKSMESVIRNHAVTTLEQLNGNKTRTAECLGISINTLKKYIN